MVDYPIIHPYVPVGYQLKSEQVTTEENNIGENTIP